MNRRLLSGRSHAGLEHEEEGRRTAWGRPAPVRDMGDPVTGNTFASRLVMAGVDLRTVQQLGGWQSLAMVQRYAHLAPEHVRAAVERLVRAAGRQELGQDLDVADPETEVAPDDVVQDTEKVTRRGGRARLKASDSKSDRGASPSGVQILSPPPI